MKQIKILYITVRSDFGGGPKHIDQLVNTLPQNILLYMAYPLDGIPYGVKWSSNSRIVKKINIPYRTFSIKTLLLLRKIIQQNSIQIIHSHGNGAGLYSRILKLFFPSIKVVHTFHGISDTYNSMIKYCLNNMVGVCLAPLANLYIAVSNGEKKLALKRGFSRNNNTVVIYNGIPAFKLKSSHKMNKPLKVVTLSRFDFAKNMDYMYRIAKILKDKPVKFIWVGDGPDFKRLKEQNDEDNLNIEFVGFSKEPYKYLLESDIYISTSRFEGLPYGLIEAASVGLPIVASNVKGNNEVVLPNKTGFLFETENEACDAIDKILQSEFLFEKMSKNAIVFFNQNFTQEKMLSKLISTYYSIL